MSEWFIYLVRTNKGSLYTGISTDVKRRFQEHQEGAAKGAKSLKGKGPLQLVFHASAGDRSLASKLEAKIKKMRKANKEALVEGTLMLSALVKEVERGVD